METLGNKSLAASRRAGTDAYTETQPEAPCAVGPAGAATAPLATLLPASGLNARQALFCEGVAGGLSNYAAYMAAGYTTERGSAHAASSRLAASPKVQARIRELQAAAGERALMSTQDLIADLEQLATADVNELMSVTVGACRHCWSDPLGSYHWRSESEMAAAVVRYMRSLTTPKPLPAPDTTGSYGFDSTRAPNDQCDHCGGAGVSRVRLANTADVSPGARKLYRGVELYQDGTVKRVLLADPLAARIELHRVRGLHIDRSINLNATVQVPALKDLTREEQLSLLESLKPTKG